MFSVFQLGLDMIHILLESTPLLYRCGPHLKNKNMFIDVESLDTQEDAQWVIVITKQKENKNQDIQLSSLHPTS